MPSTLCNVVAEGNRRVSINPLQITVSTIISTAQWILFSRCGVQSVGQGFGNSGSGVGVRSRPELAIGWRGGGTNPGTGYLADPFAVNPIRRSLFLVFSCAGIVFVPWLFGDEFATTIMLSVGWLAMTGLVIGLPVLAMSVIEEVVRSIRRRLRPPVDALEITPRVAHILLRYGYETIEEVDRTPDAALLLLSNMDNRGVREIRRAITIWKYRRWQEQGFPATGHE